MSLLAAPPPRAAATAAVAAAAVVCVCVYTYTINICRHSRTQTTILRINFASTISSSYTQGDMASKFPTSKSRPKY